VGGGTTSPAAAVARPRAFYVGIFLVSLAILVLEPCEKTRRPRTARRGLARSDRTDGGARRHDLPKRAA